MEGKTKGSIGTYLVASIPLIIILIVVALFAVRCSQTRQLAEGFDKQEIIETGEQMVADISVNGLTAVLTPMMREDYLEDYPMESMDEQVLSLLSGSGSFLAFTTETVVGKESPDSDEDFAVIMLIATYEKDEITYTITFDAEMNVVSFYAQ